jgi:hypothetical protein
MSKELLIAFLKVDVPAHNSYLRPSADWKILFDFYNLNKPVAERPLGMSCQPCYRKVWAFCRGHLLTQLLSECPAAIRS